MIDMNTGQSLEYYHLIRGLDKDIWKTSLENDLRRLAQGVGTIILTGTNTVFFIPRSAIPAGRTVSYSRLVASIRPDKTETHRVRVTVGSNMLDFPGDTTTNCASLTTTKCILKITISTPGYRFITLDIKNFYYNTTMGRYEYMKISLAILPKEIIAQYNLLQLASNGWVYLEIRKGMPGLKQAGRITNDRLKIHFDKFGYFPVA